MACIFVAKLDAQIYVVEVSGGMQNGTSWADAYTDLQTAIYNASAGDTIWVAQGTYKPLIDTLGNIPTLPEDRSFWLKNGVVIYGGFNGTETALSQRDPINQKATLEGQVIPGSFAEHVLYVYAGVDSTAIMDGFILQHGKSTTTSTAKNGSGLMLRGDAGFYNMVFKNNQTYNQGGAVYAESSSSKFVRCRFQENQTVMYDGAACNLVYSDIKMNNCIFDGNQAGRFGGAITTVETNLLVQNGTFHANTAGSNIFQFSTSGNIVFNNCIFSNQTAPQVAGNSGATVSFSDGLMPLDNNWLILCSTCIGATPTFTNPGTGDYSLAQGSRGIDETLTTTPVNMYDDYAGNPRLVGLSMDMGAFEYQDFVAVDAALALPKIKVYPSPASTDLAIQSEETTERISIYNIAGQVVQTETENAFSVAQLPAGLYFLQVTTANGIRVAHFIKQ